METKSESGVPADRNLLFGILALQMDFISKEALIAAMSFWVLAKSKSLGQILEEQGALASDRRTLLEALVQEHLKTHGNDAQQSLAAVSSAASIQEELRQIGDPDVRASLDRHSATQQSSSNPGVTTLAYAGNPTSTGGRFRILRPHRKGGLGEVFIAADGELHREVALKHIQEAHADNPVSRSRFLLEAEITGGLEHPGIVPVYGLGQYEDGRPFYAMRFIRGDSLGDAIERYHAAERKGEKSDRTSATRALELRRLLGRFIDVCNAIAYAHSRGVLHRDLKPGNIMLGQYGETLVVDWGLAKSLEQVEGPADACQGPLKPPSLSRASQTQLGQALGTPQYMSPEQAAGRTDSWGTATDVYSLGATLYCLLTGKTPFNVSDTGLLLHKIQKGDFPTPRQTNLEVPRPLEAICLKAMALQPKDRYASPRALADDIEHWLADEPVGVYPDPWLARLGRWARRHKPLVAGITALVATALVALAISTVLIWREEARTKEQRRQAEANFQTALQAVNDLLTEVAQEDLANEPRMEKKRRALLAKARAYYVAFLEKRSNDPGLRQETGLAYKRLADISRLLGENDQAKEAYTQAIALFDKLAHDFPAEPRFRQIMADSYCYLGEVLRTRSQPDAASRAYDQAQVLQDQLVAEFPGNPDYLKDLSRCHYNRGILLKDTRQPQEAQKEFHLAIELLDNLVQEYPETAEYRRHLARGYLNIGPVLRINGRPDKAEDAYQQAIRLQKDLVERYSSNPDYQYELGVSYNNLGFLSESLGRYADAEKAQRLALERFDRLMVYYPGVPVYRKEWANTQNNLAIVLARGAQWQAAAEAWHKSLDVFKKLAEENSDVPDYQGNQGMALGNLGWLCLQRNRPGNDKELSQARIYLKEGMAQVCAALKANPKNPTYLRALRDQHEYLAETLLRLGDHEGAAKVAGDLPTVLKDVGKDDLLAAGLLARCAELAQKDAKLTPAEQKSLTGQYETRALNYLQEAVRKGYRDPKLNQEPFKAYQNREDFKKLLEKIRKD